ncbi:MAG: SGNH/GDSL hydrolase family protein [Verrucomicrobiae bacterium]|nr:SGNH/GDSL hydrolase family protein [Verrucomicrobiae bacterium]
MGFRKVPLLGCAAIAAAWLFALLAVAAGCLELFLAMGERARARASAERRPKWTELQARYEPCTIQHINPHFLFFFPYDTRQRARLNNQTVTVDSRGFRGPGPEARGGRELAFFLGGSAAFGHGASSDDTTITGWLNRLQERYFFVNCGVPSWNSAQELARLCLELHGWRPALVVTFDGFNDASIGLKRFESRRLDRFPPGVPESFEKLYAMVGDIRSRNPRRSRQGLFERFLPRTREWLQGSRAEKDEDIDRAYPPEVTAAIARRYLDCLDSMAAFLRGAGIRHLAFFQPVRALHERLPTRVPRPRRQGMAAFRGEVFAGAGDLPLHDLSRLFDARYEEVPCFSEESGDDMTDAMIFLDNVHLTDLGNRIVAEEIIRRL